MLIRINPLAGMLELFRAQRAGRDVISGLLNVATVRETSIVTYVAAVIDEPAIRVPLAA